MARKTTKTSAAYRPRRNSSNPTPARAKPVKAPREKKPKIADTQEGLILEMGKVLDEVDQLLPTLHENTYWSYPSEGKLGKARERMDALTRRMVHLLPANEGYTADAIFSNALRTGPGVVPSGARPGYFMIWIDYIPVLCGWQGFLNRNGADLRIVDPAERWITDSGYQSVQSVMPKYGVEALFREGLVRVVKSKGFDLYKVSESAREKAAERLAAYPWLQAALDKGPVNPIPLPARFAMVQASLFE